MDKEYKVKNYRMSFKKAVQVGNILEDENFNKNLLIIGDEVEIEFDNTKDLSEERKKEIIDDLYLNLKKGIRTKFIDEFRQIQKENW